MQSNTTPVEVDLNASNDLLDLMINAYEGHYEDGDTEEASATEPEKKNERRKSIYSDAGGHIDEVLGSSHRF
jgi:hypothetical protein